MATTYDPTMSTPKDVVRFELGDTASPWSFTDEEITYELSVTPNPILAAAELAERKSNSFSRMASKTVGPLTIRYSDQATGWATSAANLRRKAARGAKVVFTGGAHPRSFAIGMQDNKTLDVETGEQTTSIGNQT